MFHAFESDISKISLPEKFTFPFCYVPHPIVRIAAWQVCAYLDSRTDWKDEIDGGKMFGVLVVKSPSGELGFLAAYSGNLSHRNDHPYFVPPVFNLLNPEGFFKQEEAEISNLNAEIDSMLGSDYYKSLLESLSKLEHEAEMALREYSEKMRLSKKRRDELRKSGDFSEDALIKESQFEKAEKRRLKLGYDSKIEELKRKIKSYLESVDLLKKERHKRSAALQKRLFDHFVMLNARGESKGLCEIFADYRNELPPAGAGECAAPKLLQYAFKNGFMPVAMGEFWWGNSPVGAVRNHLQFYPACKSKCEPILNFMLQGLDVESNPLDRLDSAGKISVVYEDDFLLVVDKPAEIPSTSGKDSRLSVVERLMAERKCCGFMKVVHRLDMPTSGLLIVAKNEDAYKKLQEQFASRKIEKTYAAILDGVPAAEQGKVSLPLRADYENRPRQIVDYDSGKPAVTEYEMVESYGDGTAKVMFYPHTGRTHQIRVHSAHQSGLGIPIKGDRLYGTPSDRLYLHAAKISFEHPATGKKVIFESAIPF